MKSKKVTFLFLSFIIMAFIFSSCESSRKMGCPGAITKVDVKKKNS